MMESLVPQNSQELLQKLQDISQELDTEVTDILEEDANFNPVENEWSIKEIMCHLRDGERIWTERLHRILEEDEPVLRAFNPDELAAERDYKSQDWQTVINDFGKARTANLQLFAELKPVQWVKGGIHQERGHVTVHDLAESLYNHSQTHLEQIKHVRWLAK